MKNTQYLNFPVVITQDEDGFFAFSPSIPGCHTQGNSYEEAQKSIQEAIELCLEVAEDDPDYKEKIDFGSADSPKTISLMNISVPRPHYI